MNEYSHLFLTHRISRAVDYLFERQHILESIDYRKAKLLLSIVYLKSDSYLIHGDSPDILLEDTLYSYVKYSLKEVRILLKSLNYQLNLCNDVDGFYNVYSYDKSIDKYRQLYKLKLYNTKAQILVPLLTIESLYKLLESYPDRDIERDTSTTLINIFA